MSGVELVIIAGVIVLAACLQGAVGFGLGMLAAPDIGGPPMALVRQGSSTAQLRGTMSAFFLAGALMSLAGLAAVGALDQRTVHFAAILTPAMILGFALSGLINKRLDRQRVRRVALSVSTLGAALVLWNSL